MHIKYVPRGAFGNGVLETETIWAMVFISLKAVLIRFESSVVFNESKSSRMHVKYVPLGAFGSMLKLSSGKQ